MNGEFFFVDDFVSGIRWDAKYATWDNFTGKPVDGYEANRIVGAKALCAALADAREEAASRGFGRRLLSALVQATGERPDEASALPEYRSSRGGRERLRRREVGSQPGQQCRPDALPPGDWRTRFDGR
jgi:hypothetical protein